jgi:hypothetical protein
MQFPDMTQRRFFEEKCLGGGGEEYLFGRVDSGHETGRTILGLPSPLRRESWGKVGWMIIRRSVLVEFAGDFDVTNGQYRKRYRSSVDNDER